METSVVESSAPVVLAALGDDVGAALDFAVDEARRHRCGLRVVAYEEEVLETVLAQVGEVTAEGLLVSGAPVRAVLDASADARLVVVRRRDLLHLVRALTEPDEVLPTTWADPPVACVPARWSPPEPDQPVTVGIEHPTATDALLERARSVSGDAPVRTLHTVHHRAGSALVSAARSSRLLVLGRNPADDRGGTRLGRTARTVLHESPCPVVLLPPTAPDADASPLGVPPEGCGQTRDARVRSR